MHFQIENGIVNGAIAQFVNVRMGLDLAPMRYVRNTDAIHSAKLALTIGRIAWLPHQIAHASIQPLQGHWHHLAFKYLVDHLNGLGVGP